MLVFHMNWEWVEPLMGSLIDKIVHIDDVSMFQCYTIIATLQNKILSLLIVIM